MRQSHIGVLTSSSEGLSNTIMEYMACGLAVVCSEVGGNPELVRHGQEGFLYPAGCVSELAGYIVELCQQPQKVADMGTQGRVRCEDFSLEKMVGLTLEAYRRPDATAAW
jgi:L-malate glycosyltransferase